jgi:predicted Zn-dependent peptidase
MTFSYTLRGLFSALALFAAFAHAQHPSQVSVNFRQTNLRSGLRVITAEDHTAPIVSLAVTYNVGSRNDPKGRTGFAHLFEHMMFKGSENVGTGEHFVLILNNGGAVDATTTEEKTAYFETLPANQLELALFLEADRMGSLALTQENLDNQRDAVKEERRLNIDNQAYGRRNEMIPELLYDSFAYKHSSWGSMADLSAASLDDVKRFFKTYYAPNNCVLALVGDFETTRALALVKKYFDPIPRQPAPPPVHFEEPIHTAERRATVQDPLARLAKVDILFKAVPGNTPEFYALTVLSSALKDGQSSRLYRKLVKDTQLCTNVDGEIDELRAPGSLLISANLIGGKDPALAEAAVYEELDRLTKEPLADTELRKAKSFIRRSYINHLRSSRSRALLLGQDAVFYDDPNLINTWLARIDEVTARDIQLAARKYLTPTNRTVIITLPKTAPAAPEDSRTER